MKSRSCALFVVVVFSILISCTPSPLGVMNDFQMNKTLYKELFKELEGLSGKANPENIEWSVLNPKLNEILTQISLNNIEQITYEENCQGAIIIDYDGFWHLGYFPCEFQEEKIILDYNARQYWKIDDSHFIWHHLYSYCGVNMK